MNHRHIGSKIFSANTHMQAYIPILWLMRTKVLGSIIIVCMQMIKIKNENLFISSEIYPSFFNPIYKQQQAYFREKLKGQQLVPRKENLWYLLWRKEKQMCQVLPSVPFLYQKPDQVSKPFNQVSNTYWTALPAENWQQHQQTCVWVSNYSF